MNRTTLRLRQELMEEARTEARRRNITLTALIEDSLLKELARAKAAEPRDWVELPVGRHGDGLNPRLNLDSNADIQEFLDEGLPLHKLR